MNIKELKNMKRELERVRNHFPYADIDFKFLDKSIARIDFEIMVKEE